ncbi:MAG: tRNA (adenine-N1)-methyltransferase [Desulfurococcaceae archaeon]
MFLNKALEYGDLVLLYIDHKRKAIVKLVEKGVTGFDKGFVKHDDIVGKSFGEHVYTNRGHRVYLLEPLLMDYATLISRRTQIVYPKDASLIILLANVKPGSRVLEAGVGSGHLTTILASIIGDNGRLYGFDIDKDCLETTRSNLEKLNLHRRVELKLHDIRIDPGLRDLDAVILDIPDPWNALETVLSVLKPSHPLVAFQPTMNQVEKTVIAMRKTGCFVDIHVYETLLRELKVEEGAVRPYTTAISHTGYIVFGRKIKGGV